MNYQSLFSPLKVGPYQLKHRLAMAPLTRMRAAKPSLAPRPLNAEYYAQRALETSEIPGVIDAYRQAAMNALKAGFDGVEIHGANGYLIEQFLQSHTNLRTDRYGGSIPNPTRFLMEVTNAVVEVWGADRVGVRLSPYGVANGSGEPDPMPLYTYAVEQLSPLGLAYLHFIEP